MERSEFSAARRACAYFFMCPGLVYGLLTSRMPALKARTGADEAQLGLILLSLGAASLITLSGSAWLISRWGSRAVLRAGSAALLISLPLCGAASSPLALGFACMLIGLGMGLTDVSMNAQGILLERRGGRPCMSFLHAFYSFGAVLASAAGAFFAWAGAAPLVNFLCVIIAYALFMPFASARLQSDEPASRGFSEERAGKKGIPLFIFLCGLLSMCNYASEGSVAEWGSLFLFSVKGADEYTAALAFGSFSVATVICRLFSDRLRYNFGDFPVAFCGSMSAAFGMAVVLFSPYAYTSLAGYAFMGAGFAPVIPILFSRAGSYPGIAPGKASAVVSVMSYGGMLFFPPVLGILAHRVGLDKALTVILALCLVLAAGTFLLKGEKRK